MSLETSMPDYYARRADEYDRIYTKPERQDELRVLRARLEQAFAGTDVLEIACGTGYWTEVIARSARSILATDLNEEVLTLARRRPIGPQKVTFQRADAYALPPMLGRFTAGLAAFWWSHIPRDRIAPFLAGFHRHFAPGARLLFLDNVYVEGSSTPISRTSPGGDTYQLRKLDDGSTHEVIKNFPTETELKAALASIGTKPQVELLQYYWVLSYTL